ncbi:hypothetical protein O6H91_07G003500 [Diphasiastrum complanatum]|uniref:Uncharacterized protein n=1 Tax=Diphasiastrum complanatum TaxID=34168 RepID=A0ACC2D1T6_DIPCM|nr:hypothetical protein O6H91_07G003500 [Diphasiastrum complanatum]
MAGRIVIEEITTHRGQPQRSALLIAQDSRLYLHREAGGRTLATRKGLVSAFLPEGYPNSVTADYLPFQIWDTLQGLSTYIRSMLSTQALLSGIGVGASTATVVGATFQWFLRDFTGMLGGILFTLYQGSNLDSNAKQWRLAADFLNDIGMLMDLISPLFPRAFLTLLCIGSAARSVTGVASGATRAALTQHFACQKNAADISAKEGSQETAATLVGMLFGMLLARLTAGHTGAIWSAFLFLTAFHMYANYRAVRSLCLNSLNAERLLIVLNAHLKTHKVVDPMKVATKEQLLPHILAPLSMRRGTKNTEKAIVFGARISSLQLENGLENLLPIVLKKYQRELYLLIFQRKTIQVLLHKNSTPDDHLRAYTHAVLLGNSEFRSGSKFNSPSVEDLENECLSWMAEHYSSFISQLKLSGWATDRICVPSTTWRATWVDESSPLEMKLN